MMKAKDFALVILLCSISAIFSILLANNLITSKKAMSAKVEVVQPISKEFLFSNKPYFKTNSINPTRDITIDINNNTSPLNK